MQTFSDLGVRSRLLSVLAEQGIVEPTAIQHEALPSLMQGQDVVLHAPTGSGKTLTFAIPLIERLHDHGTVGTRALIIAPTRELATQINSVLGGLKTSLRTALLFGGVGYGSQLTSLRSHPDVVVGCPGRILDMIQRRELSLEAVEFIVLDEADEMFDQGFSRTIEQIMNMLPKYVGAARRQAVLASATVPVWVERMIGRYLASPVHVVVEADAESMLEHGVVEVESADKVEALSRVLNSLATSAIVFHRTKWGAQRLARDLTRMGHSTAELQGNLSQNARDREIMSFRNGEAKVLVATNVAARGLDISHVGLVVNYELPDTPEWLIHRVGRTARNGNAGKAVTFVTEKDGDQWRKLRRMGAPALNAIDLDALQLTGEWREVDGKLNAERHMVSHKRSFRPRSRR